MSVILPLVVALAPTLADAQTQPDAGRTLQGLPQEPAAPMPRPDIKIEAPTEVPVSPGGAQVSVQDVTITGNTVFTSEALLLLFSDVQGQSFDMAGLRELAARITDFYRANNYPFARAYLPPQSMGDGKLLIGVVEGRYGRVQSISADNPELEANTQPFLDGLKTGDVINGSRLEHITMVIDDLPGIHAVPVMRPGQESGTGDLLVRIDPDKKYGGSASWNNHGNRYTGRNALQAAGYANDQITFGDQINVSAMYSTEELLLGSANYAMPLGYSGLRGNVGVSRTSYKLGKEYSNLNATGTATVFSLGANYPIIRSLDSNLIFSGTFQHKRLNDKQTNTNSDDSKTSNSLPLAMAFDARDRVGGGGVTFGSFTWTHGVLSLDSGLLATDATTAKSDGAYDKFNFTISRIQTLPANFSLYGNVNTQWARNNLDSSEGFGLGGQSGVRAYPSGEGYGDEGWLGQAELRYNLAPFTPFAFYDAGRVNVNAERWDTTNNTRSLAGSGLGVRYVDGNWNGELISAWRRYGGAPQSDSRNTNPMIWASMGYAF